MLEARYSAGAQGRPQASSLARERAYPADDRQPRPYEPWRPPWFVGVIGTPPMRVRGLGRRNRPSATPVMGRADVNNHRTLVGLDVHSKMAVPAVFDLQTGELPFRRLSGPPRSVVDFLEGLPGPVLAVYEAGPTGATKRSPGFLDPIPHGLAAVRASTTIGRRAERARRCDVPPGMRSPIGAYPRDPTISKSTEVP